ncbi:MAG: DUF1580 domain-containing protein [Pirellulaceae bacterium]|nr:DUF1580 domain-containing protein [Pirellulaceae bacterium]
MAIDPNTENIISLTEAAQSLPRRRAGKKPHLSCLYRWSTTGCRGVVLETIQVGGTRCTSKEALARFFRRLTDPAQHGPTHPETPRQHDHRRQREIAAAERHLDEEGL